MIFKRFHYGGDTRTCDPRQEETEAGISDNAQEVHVFWHHRIHTNLLNGLFFTGVGIQRQKK